MFYCDPPYWKTEGYGVDFPFEEYERLVRFASESKGKVIISINDHPDIRTLFGSMKVTEVNYGYTVGGAKNRKKATELIYQNY